MTPLLSFATPSPAKVHISADGLATMTYLFNNQNEKEIKNNHHEMAIKAFKQLINLKK